jgi:hypothetical protein
MMQYCLLSPKDSRHFDYILYEGVDDEPLRLRPELSVTKCFECGKIDEYAALPMALPMAKIRSKADFLDTCDGFILMSMKFFEALKNEGISGISALPLGQSTTHVLIVPEVLAETDRSRMGMELLEVCARCGRACDTKFWPIVASMRLPDEKVIFASEVWCENRRGKVLWLYASETIVKVLKKLKPTGMEYYKY